MHTFKDPMSTFQFITEDLIASDMKTLSQRNALVILITAD